LESRSGVAIRRGQPIEEVYNHLTRANQWIASSVWSCEVADAG